MLRLRTKTRSILTEIPTYRRNGQEQCAGWWVAGAKSCVGCWSASGVGSLLLQVSNVPVASVPWDASSYCPQASLFHIEHTASNGHVHKFEPNIQNILNINNAVKITIKRWSFWTQFFENMDFKNFENVRKTWIWENVFLYLWCALYYNLLFLIRLSDYVSFSVHMKIF